MNNLGDRIKELRIQNKLTQKEMGEIVGLHGTNISRIESGKVFPTSDVLYKLSEFFNTSCDYLIKGESAKTHISLNTDEIDIISKYRKLQEEEKKDIHEYIDFRFEKSKKVLPVKQKSSNSLNEIDSLLG